jgi:predicted choloylglycine hydrolase
MYHPRFKGTHYDMGYKYGRLMQKHNAHISEIDRLTDEKKLFGGKCIALCREIYPEVIYEMQGLADGMEISFNDFAGWIFCIYCYEYQHGCTCFAFKDDRTIIFGRNSDFFTKIKKACESALYSPDRGHRFIGNSTAMVQMEDGYNEHGLAIGLTYIFPRVIKPGLNAGILLRYILEKCRTVQEALEALRTLPISSSQTFTMVDKSGAMAVVECNCEKIIMIEPEADEHFVVSANNFVSPEMQGYERLCWVDAKERYNVARHALQTRDNYSFELAQEILGGKHGFMCQYESRKYGFDTLWSTVYDLSNDRIFRAEGNPSKTAFKEDFRLRKAKTARKK